MNAVDLLETLARATWRTLDRSHRRRVLFGEDAITSIILNVLASLPSTIVCEDTRAHEATKGCDFELWVGNDTHGWRRYAIQAKKLTVSSSRYAKLNHVVAGNRQIDILERYAKANRAVPLYCFYNYSNQPHGWNCPLPLDTEQLGCSVAPSAVVRKALSGRGRRSFSWIHKQPATLPWRCLIGCPHLTRASATPLQADWASLQTGRVEKLPASLRRLREAEERGGVFADAQDLFNAETNLRPGWIAVIESSA